MLQGHGRLELTQSLANGWNDFGNHRGVFAYHPSEQLRLGSPHVSGDDLRPREVGRRTFGVRATALQHQRAVADFPGELLQQSALADARIPGDSDHAALAMGSSLRCGLQTPHFRRPANEDGAETEGTTGGRDLPAS